ncbi:MAG: aldo/keto reductase [Burkholderiales bacterium]|nr:aldo/keto reductase [Burkholderiales bacterium]
MKLALGTAQFGTNYGIYNLSGRMSLLEAEEIIRVGREHGIDTLDTAIAYGDSEALLGQLDIGHWKIITKLPSVPDNCTDIEQWVRNQIRQSMTRLRVTKLHGRRP